jgi:hypothetical protein
MDHHGDSCRGSVARALLTEWIGLGASNNRLVATALFANHYLGRQWSLADSIAALNFQSTPRRSRSPSEFIIRLNCDGILFGKSKLNRVSKKSPCEISHNHRRSADGPCGSNPPISNGQPDPSSLFPPLSDRNHHSPNNQHISSLSTSSTSHSSTQPLAPRPRCTPFKNLSPLEYPYSDPRRSPRIIFPSYRHR